MDELRKRLRDIEPCEVKRWQVLANEASELPRWSAPTVLCAPQDFWERWGRVPGEAAQADDLGRFPFEATIGDPLPTGQGIRPPAQRDDDRFAAPLQRLANRVIGDPRGTLIAEDYDPWYSSGRLSRSKYQKTYTIRLQACLTTGQRFYALAHELGHLFSELPRSYRWSSSVSEVLAESVAYIVCRNVGADLSGWSPAYIWAWATVWGYYEGPLGIIDDHHTAIESAVERIERIL